MLRSLDQRNAQQAVVVVVVVTTRLHQRRLVAVVAHQEKCKEAATPVFVLIARSVSSREMLAKVTAWRVLTTSTKTEQEQTTV